MAMTADELRAIAARKAEDDGAQAEWRQDRTSHSQLLLDRDALLDLLRGLASATRAPWTRGRERCALCKDVVCAPDCAAKALEALR